MAEDTGLKVWCQCHFQWHDLHANFHQSHQLVLKLLVEDIQTDSMVLLEASLSFLWEVGKKKGKAKEH
jgi:hypothetical protein